MDRRANTAMLAVVACLLWSSAFAGVKIGLEYSPPIQFAGVRFFLSGLLVFPLAYRKNKDYFRILRKHAGLILLFAFLQTFLQYIMFYKGIDMIPSGVAAIIIGSQPLFIALLAHWFMPGDRMSWSKTGIILLGILGVVLVSLGRDPESASGRIALMGIILMVGINILSGINNVIIARDKKHIPPLVISSASMSIGGLALFLLAIPLEGIRPALFPSTGSLYPLPFYLSLLWLSFLSAAAVSIWLSLLKRPGVKVSDLNLWKFIIPVAGALLSWILIPGERAQVLSVAGMAIISLSLILLNLISRKKLTL